VLGPNTPGFQKGVGTMIVFTGGDQYSVGRVPVPVPTVVGATDKVRDANSGTFYSALSNVDIEIGAGNPAAAAVRFRMAQHAFLSHMDFRLGSAFAGVYQAGNIMEDVHFHGGRYGIVTEKTSPAWQFTLIDSTFDGQRDAAIREHEVDLTLVNVAIKNTPVGIEIDKGYSDSLWGKNVRFENVSKAGVVISAEDNVFTQVGFDNAVASNTPVFARFRDSGKTVAGKGRAYRVASFTYGLTLPGLGQMGEYKTRPTSPRCRRRGRRARHPRCRRSPTGPTSRRWASRATARPTTPPPCRRRSTRTACSICRSASTWSPTPEAAARHGADRPASGLTQLVIPDNNPRHAGVGAVTPDPGDAEGRRQHPVRDRALHRPHQSARLGAAVAVGRGLAGHRRQDHGRRRHAHRTASRWARPRRAAAIRWPTVAGTRSIPASG
jgi:hypothetical protein